MTVQALRKVYIWNGSPAGCRSDSRIFAVHPECYKGMKHSLLNAGVEASRIVDLTSEAELHDALEHAKPGVLVVPGGALGWIYSALSTSLVKIRQAVEARGWNYLGSCAGAALACLKRKSMVPFYKIVDDMQGIGLLSATATFGIYDEQPGEFHGKLVKVQSFACGRFREFTSFWNEGNYFKLHNQDIKETANYIEWLKIASAFDSPHAAVQQTVGVGKVAALSIHPELNDEGYAILLREASSSESLSDDAVAREEFLNNQFRYLGVIA